jgi:hypothetical protein
MMKKFFTVIYTLSAVAGILIMLLINNGILSATLRIIPYPLFALSLILIHVSGREDRRSGVAQERGKTARDERGRLINARAGNTVYILFMVAFIVAAGVCHGVKQLIAGNILFGFYIGGAILKQVMLAHYRKRM